MEFDASNVRLFSGTSHPAFAQEVAEHLGVKVSGVFFDRFPDGEINLQILESVRGYDVFVFQSIALDPNNYLMELLIMVDALKRASALTVTAVIPYYGYCRQDRKDRPRVSITAKLVANLLVQAGVSKVLTIDLHTGQIQGYFDIPVDNLMAMPVLAGAFQNMGIDNFVVVTPDLGSIKLVKAYAKQLKTEFVIVDKQRLSSREVEVVTIIGDVKGKNVLLADDMCSTAGTLVSAAKACREKGAERIFSAITHGLFVGDAVEKIEKSPIEALLMSNTIPTTSRLSGSTKIRVVSVAGLFAKAIRCIVSHKSMSSLFELNIVN